LNTTFKVKGQGHQAALLTAVLASEAAAAMGVVSAPTGEEESGGCISWRHAHLQLVYINSVHGAKRRWGETSMGRNVRGAKSP